MSWFAKTVGAYDKETNEAKQNAHSILQLLRADGYTFKSACAALGNMSYESGLNPWRWQGDYVPSFTEFESWSTTEAANHGYGLVQFTPAKNYINAENAVKYGNSGYSPHFSDKVASPNDGNSQTKFFTSIAKSSWLSQLYTYYAAAFSNIGVDISPWYYTTYENFKKGINNTGDELSLADLTGAFELCYERPTANYAASSYATRVANAEYWFNNLPKYGKRKSKWIYYMKRRK